MVMADCQDDPDEALEAVRGAQGQLPVSTAGPRRRSAEICEIHLSRLALEGAQ